MTRSTAREIAMHISFETEVNTLPIEEIMAKKFEKEYYASLAQECSIYEEYPSENQMKYIERVSLGVAEHAAELDSYIEKFSRGWKIGRISRVAAAIMRVAMFEILYMTEIPNSAAADEAVKLCKKYEEPETVSFLNGILGSFIRDEAKLGDQV